MITSILNGLINAYILIIFIYVIMSWIPNSQTGVLGQVRNVLGTLCDPFLDLFRRFIPPIGGMIDITPIVAWLVLEIVRRLVFIIL